MADNLTNSNPFTLIEQSVRINSEHLAGCLVQLFTYQVDNQWELFFGQLRFSHEEVTSLIDFDYGSCRATESFLSVSDGLNLVRSVLVEKQIAHDQTTIPITGSPNTQVTFRSDVLPGYWPSSGDDPLGHEWPSRIVSIPTDSGRQHLWPQGILVGKDLPLYPNFGSLVTQRVGFDMTTHVFRNNLIVTVPNMGARIIDASVAGRTLTVRAQAMAVPTDDLVLKSYAIADDYFHSDDDFDGNPTTVSLDVGGSPDSWGVVLCHKQSAEIIDYRRAFGHETPSITDVKSLTQESLESVLRLGENNHREFKPWPSDDKGKEQVAESAIAFANSDGGVLFVGVGDDGRPAGADPTGTDALLSVLRDRSDPPIYADTHAVSVDDNTVHVLLVTRSDNRPHLSKRTGACFVRVGSTDRRATRQELDEMYRSQGQGLSIGYTPDIPWAAST